MPASPKNPSGGSPLRPAAALTGWGGLGVDAVERRGEDLVALTQDAVLTRGLGRAYGDAALPPAGVGSVAGTSRADRLLSFDEASGLLVAEAGLSLQTLKRLFLPRRWFTPVSPGTQFVTLGGMVAADVHGKNHHVHGTVGRHIDHVVLRVASGKIVRASRTEQPELFYATLGGMGLTGHILVVGIHLKRIPSPWIYSEKRPISNITAFVHALRADAASWPMTVGWIDCLAKGPALGRGYVWRGRWATAAEAPPHPPGPELSPVVPLRMPDWLMNRWSIKLVNEAIYRLNTIPSQGVVTPDSFYYPLDAIRNWNLLYGRRGFTQHQAVIPYTAGEDAIVRYVELIARLGGASPLCVLKDCGEEGEGMLSFPMPGMSVALDLPMSKDMPEVVAELNRFVIAHGGRVYLAKDTFTTQAHFEAMEGERLDRFQAVRRAWDPTAKLRSALSVRLMGDPAGPVA